MPKTWCFWVVGCVGYRGYYDPAQAEALAVDLRGRRARRRRLPGAGVFDARPAADRRLARRPAAQHLHRLSGRRARAADLPRARAPGGVRAGRHALQRVVREHGREDRRRALARRAAQRRRRAPSTSVAEARRADFRALTSRYRDELARLYASAQADDAKRAGKAAILARLRADYAAMKATRWNGYAGYDAWFAAGQQRRIRRPRQLHRAGAGVREAVRARRPRFPALLCRGQADRRLAARPSGTPHSRRLSSHRSTHRCQDARHGRHPHPPQPSTSASPRRARPPGSGPRPSRRSSAWSAR